MMYVAPTHVILRRHTDAIDDKDMAYLERALQVQMRELAAAYKFDSPGVTYVTKDADIPTTEAVGIDFVDNDGLDGSVAHHGWMAGAGFPWSLVGVKEDAHWTLSASHEACEYVMNLRLDRYAIGPEGWRWPMEVCDMVEDGGYPIMVNRFEVPRSVMVSNFVLPSFWKLDGKWPYDYLGVLTEPFSVEARGGYALVEKDGKLVQVGSSRRRQRQRARSRVQWLKDQTWPGR